MMDVIAGAFGGLKTAAELTQGLLALKTDAAVSTKVIELNGVISNIQSQLFSAQIEYANALDKVRELEEKLAFNNDLKKYKLIRFETGALAYGLSSEVEENEVTHYICPNCYSIGRKSILQPATDYLSCQIPDCKFCIKILPKKLVKKSNNWRTI